MKAALIMIAVGGVLLQRELNPNLMSETMAAQLASDFAELKMGKERPAFHSAMAAGTCNMDLMVRPVGRCLCPSKPMVAIRNLNALDTRTSSTIAFTNYHTIIIR